MKTEWLGFQQTKIRGDRVRQVQRKEGAKPGRVYTVCERKAPCRVSDV
jgi:hypothetical protein